MGDPPIRELRIRVGTWNTKFGRADDSLIAGRELDLLCLQEARRETVDRFAAHFDWAFFAHDPNLLEGVEPCAKHAPAILGRAPFVAVARPPMRHLVAPDKVVVADVRVAGTPSFFTLASYHAHNGKQGPDHCDKPRLTMQVGEWLEGEWGPVIIGMDTNSPGTDHPDPELIDCCFSWLGPRQFERRLLGAEATHRLGDVLRTWLCEHPDEMAAIRQERPDGPLAVSYRTGKVKGRQGNPCRYDHIFATRPDFRVERVEHLYDEGCEAGSDHALVIADLVCDVEGYPDRAERPAPTRGN